MCLPAERRSIRSRLQRISIYTIPLSGKVLAAGKKKEADPKISCECYSTHSTGVSPNKIRAERSEQETDSTTVRFQEKKPNQNSQGANPRARPPDKDQPGITISNGSGSRPKQTDNPKNNTSHS
ncbi:hypothetical protein FYZ48_03105 [Gimesia chilikensis]|uniref:hypothetical protein n=1 Tax=Gimesia chilikensis TaxID=2605989 RepID=UPI0011EC766E|nr:hypothetical protein [Gimesia chilikensis]KAA0142502.1 hypothetical protein FYZ48_03105 [Gimesia chilikensis]